jgi:hypothetical protein
MKGVVMAKNSFEVKSTAFEHTLFFRRWVNMDSKTKGVDITGDEIFIGGYADKDIRKIISGLKKLIGQKASKGK